MKIQRISFVAILFAPLLISINSAAQSTLVEYTFTGETPSAETVHPNVTANDLSASAGNITFGSTTGGWSGSGVPYAQGLGGWNEPSANSAKFLTFTVTADPFSLINTNNLSFLYRATGLGPDSMAVIVNTDTLFYNAFNDGNTLSFSEPVTLTNEETVQVKILGWGDTGSGGGAFRIDDIELTGNIIARPQVIDFDDVNLWTLDGSGYSVNHEYNDAGMLFTGGPALRETQGQQDGFDETYQNSTYSWRLQNEDTADWRATLNLEREVSSFGFQTRRWIAGADYDVSYSTDAGNTFTSVGTIDDTFLNNSSDWKKFTYTLPVSEEVNAGEFIVKLEANGGTERIFIDNFEYTATPLPQGWKITTVDQLFEIDFDQTVTGVNNNQYNGSGFTPSPSAGQLNSGAWSQTGMSEGDVAFNNDKTTGDFARGSNNGTTGTGGNWAFTVAANNRALGIKPAGSDWTPGTITLRALNQTGQTINNVELSYLVYIFNNQNRSNSYNFSYSSDGTNYTAVNLQDFTSEAPQESSPQWRKNKREIILSGLNWADEEYLYLRWSGDDIGGSNSRDAFALDDIELIAEPSSTHITGLQDNEYESAVVSRSQTLTGDLDISRYLRTAAGAELEIASGNNLHVTGSIENNGTITVKNNGSLTQEGGSDQNTNNGTYNIEREGTANTMAYNGWSSPVAGVWLHDNSGVFSNANACDVFVFDAPSQTWKYDFPTTYSPDCGTGPVNFTSNVVISGADGIANTARGYFAPGGGSATRIFSGQAVHNADISISAQAGTGSTGSNWTGNNWNLIGNPYPSSINIEDFISANSSALNTETIYVWDDDQSGNPGSSTDYIAINNIGTTSSPGGSSNSITDYLASCQGFFIQSDGTQTINFTNAMREKGNNNQFRSDDDKPSRFWLQLSTDSAASEMLFGVIADAAIDFDKKYDAPKRYAHQNLNLSGQLPDGEEMMIMGVPKPLFDRPFSIPLTVQSNTQNTVTFNISQNQLYEDNLNIALIDKSLNDTAFMLEETYTTALDSAGKTADRFELLFFIKGSLSDTGTSIANLKNNELVKIYTAPGQIIVESAGSRITSIYISDVSGRSVWSEPDTRETVKQIPTANWNTGVYIIRTKTENGETKTRKLFLN